MHPALRSLLSTMGVGGVIGLGHGFYRGTPIKDTLIGATAPVWLPIMMAIVPLRVCSYLNPAKHKSE